MTAAPPPPPPLKISSQPRLLFLRFSSFHANPPDLQHRFGFPAPEGLFKVLPKGIQGFRLPLPVQADLEQIPDVVLGEDQEGVGQVQPDPALVAARGKEKRGEGGAGGKKTKSPSTFIFTRFDRGAGGWARYSHVNVHVARVFAGAVQLHVEGGVGVVRMLPVEHVHLHLVVVACPSETPTSSSSSS